MFLPNHLSNNKPAADVDEKRRKNYIFQRTGSEFKQAYWMFRGKLQRVSNIREHTTDCKNKSLRFKAYIFSGRELLGCKKSKKITIQQHGYHSSQALLQKVNLLSICVKMAWNKLIFVLSFFFSSMKEKQRTSQIIEPASTCFTRTTSFYPLSTKRIVAI